MNSILLPQSVTSLSLSKIAGVLNIARLDGSRRAMACDVFLTALNGINYQFQSVGTIRRNVILLFVRKKVFVNEPLVTLSEKILIEIRRQYTRRAQKHVLLEFLCKQSKSSL